MHVKFKDRAEAASMLADKLIAIMEGQMPPAKVDEIKDEFVIIAIARGGVVIGDIIASKLGVKLDVVVSTKVSAPFNSDLNVGTVMHDGSFVPNKEIILGMNISQKYLNQEIQHEVSRIEQRLVKFRGTTQYDVQGKKIILVDDGVCSGCSTMVAAKWVAAQNIAKLVIAVPVGPKGTVDNLMKLSDSVVVLYTPVYCDSVGEFYHDFPEVTDREVSEILKKHKSGAKLNN